jgi:hypothetical protein
LTVEVPAGLLDLLLTHCRVHGVSVEAVVGGALCDALGVAPYAELANVARTPEGDDERTEERANVG